MPDEQVNAPDITADDLTSVFTDLYSGIGEVDNYQNHTKRGFVDALKQAYGTPESMSQLPTDQILGRVIKASNSVGITDDIAAKFARNVRRLKGERLAEGDISDVFASYDIPLPPLEGVDFTGAAGDEADKLDGWNEKAKANYRLKTKTAYPELLAYRDEVFQRIDDSTNYLKRKVGATDSATVDFIGRLGQGAASFLDTIGLDSAAQFISNHVVTNPEWDDSTSATVGQALGQVATQLGAAGAAVVSAGAGAAALGVGYLSGAASTAAVGALNAISSFHGTAKERYDRVLADTGNATLAEDATTGAGYYLEAGLDFLADTIVVGSKIAPNKFIKELATGKEVLQEKLAKGIAAKIGIEATAPWLTKTAEIAGDAVIEGGTEAAQGAVQDQDLANLTNQPDKYKAYDLNARARDFLGGFVGGGTAGPITLASKLIAPKVDTLLNPLKKNLSNAASPVTDKLNTAIESARSTASDYVNSTVSNIAATAADKAASIIEGASPVIGDTLNTIKEGFNSLKNNTPQTISKVYTSMRDTLGNFINNPDVQPIASALGSIYESVLNRAPVSEETATNVQNESVKAPFSEATSATAETTPLEVQATEQVDNALKDVGVEVPPAIEIPSVGEPLVTQEQSSEPMTRKAISEVRQKLGIMSTDLSRTPLKDKFVQDTAPQLKDFFKQALPQYNSGGVKETQKQQSENYLNSPESFKALTDAGLTPEEASDYKEKIRSINNSELPNYAKKEGIRQVQFDLVNRVSTPENFTKAADLHYANPKQNALVKAVAPQVAPITPESAPDFPQPLRKALLLRAIPDENTVDSLLRKERSDPELKAKLDSYVAEKLGGEDLTNPDEALRNIDLRDMQQAAQNPVARPRYNTGALKNVTTKTPYEIGRVFEKLGIPIEVTPAERDIGPDARITGSLSKTGATLASPTLRGSQASGVLLHELGEKSINEKGVTERLSQDPKVLDQAKALSDSIRVTPTDSINEHLADAAALAVSDPSALNSYPELQQALADPQNKTLNKIRKVFEAEEQIPLEKKLQETSKKRIAEYQKARKALENRNIDTRTVPEKLRAIAQEIRNGVFNKSGNIFDTAKKLAKAVPLYNGLKDSLGRYYEQFKNRAQIAEAPILTMQLFGKNILEPSGISTDTFNEYLQSNRIANETTYWEQQIRENPADMDVVRNALLTNPDVIELLDAQVNNDIRSNNPENFINGLHEIVARSYAEGRGLSQSIVNNLNEKVKGNPLVQAIALSFNPENASRQKIANPNLETGPVAQANIQRILSSLTPAQQTVINQGRDLMAKLNSYIVNKVYESGGIGLDTKNFYDLNKNAYATFQLSDAIVNDPFVDAALRGQTGTTRDIAGPFEVTALKMGAMAAKAARFNFQNSLASLYYNSQQVGGPKIEPVVSTGTSWNKNHSQAKAATIPIEEFFNGLESGKFNEDGTSLVVTAQDGEFTLHRIQDPTVDAVLNPVSATKQAETLQYLNTLQVGARVMFTTFNPVFAVRSALRIASKLNSVRKIKTGNKLTLKDTLKAAITAPLGGIPFSAQDKELISTAWRMAGDYLRNGSSLDARAAALDQSIDPSSTWQQLVNTPYALNVLEQQGDLISPLLSDIVSGLAPEDIRFGTALAQNKSRKELTQFITGKPTKKNVFERVNESNLPPQALKTAARAFGAYLDYVRNLNSRLELTEKLSGIGALMQEGRTFEQAVQEGNFYFGNPDPRGGGSWKPFISPFFLFATPSLNGLRVLKDVYGSSTQGDPRLLRAALMSVRNNVATHPLVWGAATYAISRAMLGSDDEATKQAEVIKKLIEKIPLSTRNSGLAVPLFFRDPRTRDWILPPFVNSPEEIDPSWETVYLQAPFDQTTAFTSGLVGGLIDGIDGGLGPSALAANIMTSAFKGAVPNPGPVAQASSVLYDIGEGRQPTDMFSGSPIVSDSDFQRGGTQLAGQYMQYLINQFVPLVAKPSGRESEKTKLLQPFGSTILDSPFALAKLGVLNSSNYGDVQRSKFRTDTTVQEVKTDVGTSTSDKILRLTELNNLIKTRRDQARQDAASQGLAPSTIKLASKDLVPPQLLKEYTALTAWKRGVYDMLTEQAEMEFLKNGKSDRYRGLLDDLNESTDTIPGPT